MNTDNRKMKQRTMQGIGLFAVAGALLASPIAGLAASGQLTQLRLPAEVAAAAPSAAARPTAPLLSAEPARIGAEMDLTVGKSSLLRLPEPVGRISVGNPAVADVTTISERELYILGKDIGATNIIVWAKDGQATVIDVKVSADPSLLQGELAKVLPDEKEIQVVTSADSIILMGTVADPLKASQAVEVARAWVRRLTRGLVLPVTAGDGKTGTTIQVGETRNVQATARLAGPQVINMLRVRAPMQVMLEVKVAEVSKTLLNRLGVNTAISHTGGDFTYSLLSKSNFFNQLLGSAGAAVAAGHVLANPRSLSIDAQSDEGLINLLAEPNIMAISGQEASFRAGGKIFIPVARANDVTGGTTVTLEEKEFGVGVKFKPTVIEGTRINLQVAPEVSELQQNGTPFSTVNGATSVLPSFTLRRAETTVQLNDGQSFMIAGLVQNNATATINRFPGLGEIPILGALFRSTDFQHDRTELMFVITPRLVKPLPANYALPNDGVIMPSPAELMLEGKLEGARPGRSDAGTTGGFEMK